MNGLLITGLVVLAALACGLTATFVYLGRTTQYTVVQAVFWLVVKFVNLLLWRTTVEGLSAVPASGGGVIICNHRSSIDPFFLQIKLRRVVRWMVAREYCERRALGWFLRVCEVIPVNRGGLDTAATKKAIRVAAEGSIIGMFPEGRINTTDALMRSVRPGAIVVALKARVPVIPCYTEGAPYGGRALSPLLMRAKVHVRVGEPIDLSAYFGREKDAALVRQLLIRCVKAIAQLAGQPEFEPEVAGRDWKSAEGESSAGDAPDGSA
ncbi:MAG: 1-acyl-sn-glycerol-3-phosphate acyltransferase [Planctomycetes bacterium]|nr:1-acyl-sn-glycerol-3-phosphate acyltransferase [Planctomycetota bacterium]